MIFTTSQYPELEPTISQVILTDTDRFGNYIGEGGESDEELSQVSAAEKGVDDYVFDREVSAEADDDHGEGPSGMELMEIDGMRPIEFAGRTADLTW